MPGATGGDYRTGYIAPDIDYPLQPVKAAALSGVTAVNIGGERGFPIIETGKALGYGVSSGRGAIIFIKGDETLTANTKDNPDFLSINGETYAKDSFLRNFFNVNFRYFENGNVLEIYK